jgi:hypothetical protein
MSRHLKLTALICNTFGRPQQNEDIRSERKYIVFLSQLLLLFQFCRRCKSEDVLVETRENGTMITVEMHCGNPECVEKEFVWQSQPKIDGLRTGAGNLLLSFAILMAGASASKVLRVLSHMGVACFSLRQFFRHQKVSIIGCLPICDPTNLIPINIFIQGWICWGEGGGGMHASSLGQKGAKRVQGE